MKKAIPLFLILFVFCLFLSCKINVEVSFDQKTFNTQRKLWQDSNVKNYQYEFSAIGFTSYYGTIFVENGNFKNDSRLHGNSNIDCFMEYSTIDEIYKTIENTFRETNNKKQPINDSYLNEISVKYDKINHIPIEINYKYHVPSNVAVDGTFDYEITNFSK